MGASDYFFMPQVSTMYGQRAGLIDHRVHKEGSRGRGTVDRAANQTIAPVTRLPATSAVARSQPRPPPRAQDRRQCGGLLNRSVHHVVDRNPGLADVPKALSRMLRPRDRMLWVLLANI